MHLGNLKSFGDLKAILNMIGKFIEWNKIKNENLDWDTNFIVILIITHKRF